jgi:hypothetical protein
LSARRLRRLLSISARGIRGHTFTRQLTGHDKRISRTKAQGAHPY